MNKENILRLLSENKYNEAADFFCKENDIDIKFMFSNCGKNKEWHDKKNRNIYNVIFSRPGKSFVVTFHDSINNTEKKIRPKKYDILACLTKFDPGNFSNFCMEFGYDTDSFKAFDCYKSVCEEYEKVSKFFTTEEMEVLREIN